MLFQVSQKSDEIYKKLLTTRAAVPYRPAICLQQRRRQDLFSRA
jgi:hypothetical protein